MGLYNEDDKELNFLSENDEVTILKVDYDYLLSFYNKYKKIEAILKCINMKYYRNISKIDFLLCAIRGIFQGLDDPDSQYLIAEEYDNYMLDIGVKNIESKIIENNIGLIKIVTFNWQVLNEFVDHLSILKNKNIMALVIDLRNNMGGNIEQCVEIAKLLISEGVLLNTIEAGDNRTIIKAIGQSLEVPLAVLINEKSASASEVLASAIKENNAGIVIGTRSFGKGTIQTLIPLSKFDGSGIKLTIKEFISPKGNKINGVGVTPDYYIENDVKVEIDIQLEKAIEMLKKKIDQ